MNIKVIPAIDLIGGRCVRLHKGRFEELTTYDVPVHEMFSLIAGAGFKRVHVVDLDGARIGEPLQLELIAGLSKQFGLEVQSGGGYRNIHQVARALDLGISAVIIGSAAVRNPQFFTQCLERFGSDRIILAADVDGNQVKVSAWEEESGQTLEKLLETFVPQGLIYVLITDIQRDGTMKGPATVLYGDLQARYPGLEIIASGGVGQLTHLELLAEAGIRAVVLGKALYENKLTLEQLSGINKAYAG
ncbi:MAG: 1-(5-phosphoribosyl)-5-[(5-phosphoribosylamino)methylideneamino] imidazole-4-carboxamide isomerase [Bacteroidetes bacterium]|nr:1-(5-phosphoribosyl)-5-[(5-phosphoribosylamino)methylideneamino] imidazole-4-carboxamide isomerase [Bacteroidota bacterium]